MPNIVGQQLSYTVATGKPPSCGAQLLTITFDNTHLGMHEYVKF
jgi:hypothetical protein